MPGIGCLLVSDAPLGPGWWIASDGKWYPPESHPSRRVQQSPRPPQQLQQPSQAVQQRPYERPFTAPTPADNSFSTGSGWRGRRPSRTQVGIAATLLVVVAVVVGVLVSEGGPTRSPAATSTTLQPTVGGTATISVAGTTLSVTLTKVVPDAPIPAGAPLPGDDLPIGVELNIADTGNRSYGLSGLGFVVHQGSTESGGAVSPGTTAGPALAQAGSLAPAAVDDGWVTFAVQAAAGNVTAVTVIFDTPDNTIEQTWKVSP